MKPTGMIITWYGQSCFRIDTREAVLAIDPFSKDIGLVPPRFQTDIVLVTHDHYDHANAGTFPGEPFLIRGPGEYERQGISVSGIPSFHDAKGGRERGLNTIYKILAEGISIAHLGDFGEAGMREETLEALGNVDILLIPVGGTFTVDGEAAAKIANQIQARIIIPMHYRLPGLKVNLDPAERFLKALGGKAEELDRIVIKKKDLPETGARIVVLARGGGERA